MHRIDATVLRFLPAKIKDPLKKIIGKIVNFGRQGINATAGKLTDTLVNRCARPLFLILQSHASLTVKLLALACMHTSWVSPQGTPAADRHLPTEHSCPRTEGHNAQGRNSVDAPGMQAWEADIKQVVVIQRK